MVAKPLRKVLLLLVIICIGLGTAAAQEQKSCALILMHGKWHNPREFGFFGKKIEPTCDYKSIEMPWSGRRNYDQPYAVALAEIQAQVNKFRKEGYKRVILVGHSFGANAALAYMAEVGDADGVISLAAGHVPHFMYQKGIGSASVDKARGLIESGKGEETLSMTDFNQGKRRDITMSANVLLSYFDPQGLGHMQATISRFKKAVPILWVVGTQDPLYPFGTLWIDLALKHPANKYIVVQADHVSTPDVSGAEVLAWIKSLP
jgi:pimeloyl-ACP methyl ester carboxylesterase